MAVHKYDAVQQRIRDHILTDLQPGQSLDSERRLAEQLGVSRVTIRRALTRLEEEGLVTRVHGSGTYKADSVLVGKVLQPTSFSDDMRQRGLVPSYRVLEVETREAGEEIASALSIEPGDEVLSLRRLLLADGEPMALEQAYLPLERFPGIAHEDFTVSLYEILRAQFGRYMRSTRRKIRAVTLPPQEADLLETEDGAAALVVVGTTSDPYGMPMEHFTTTFRADRYEFDLTVRADR